MGRSLTSESVRALALSARGELVVTARLAVRFGPRDVRSFSIPSDKPGVPEPLDKLGGRGGQSPRRVRFCLGRQEKKVFRFLTPRDQPQGTFDEARERQVSRIVLDGEGGIVMLDRDEKSVRVLDEGGKPLRAIASRGPGYELKKPIDVAVDSARISMSPTRKRGRPCSLASGSIASVLSRRPRGLKAVTLDPAGAVLVYDESVQRVLRFK